MIIKLTYDKTSGEITLVNDIDLIGVELGSVVDGSEALIAEIAVSTTQYEIEQQSPDNLIEE